MPAKKPHAVNKHIVCSECGLDWKRHGTNPSLEKCIELLKADLATANRRPYGGIVYTQNTGGVSGGGNWSTLPVSL